ncbi:hypothetical protein [Nocardioides marmoraquaticus]
MRSRTRCGGTRTVSSFDATADGGWSRRRLLAVLIGAATAVVVLLASLGYTVAQALGAGGEDTEDTADQAAMYSAVAGGQQRRDEIAEAPMTALPAGAVNPTEEKPPAGADEPDSIEVPSGVVPGPAAVLTGFDHTPEGAVGQLAAIETTVLQSMSLATTNEVYQAWALPGGTGAEAWPLTTSVRAFLQGAGMEATKDEAARVSIEPAGAIVKGTDGPDWTLACVLVTLTASLEQEVQIGYGHCERMQWVGGRWMIAPGTPPAPAPSAWPGSPAAVEAGWSTWTTATRSSNGSSAGGAS